MGNAALLAYALASLAATALNAQDLAGNWQGILKIGSEETRQILQIGHGEEGWTAKLVNIDETHDWGLSIPVSTFAVKGPSLRFTVDRLRITYEGKLSANHRTLVGIWTQGQPRPLEFKLPTREAAWRDPSLHRTRFINVIRKRSRV